jgi:hypothetical protein
MIKFTFVCVFLKIFSKIIRIKEFRMMLTIVEPRIMLFKPKISLRRYKKI